MRVKLSPQQPYWMLLDPATNQPKFYLSFDAPGPIEISEETLSPYELQIFQLGLKMRIIQQADSQEPVQATPNPEDEIDAAYLVQDDPTFKAQELLQQNATKCLEAIGGLVKSQQLALLEAMHSLETQGKNSNGAPRKTVLTALEKAIQGCAGVSGITDSEPEDVEIHFDTPAE